MSSSPSRTTTPSSPISRIATGPPASPPTSPSMATSPRTSRKPSPDPKLPPQLKERSPRNETISPSTPSLARAPRPVPATDRPQHMDRSGLQLQTHHHRYNHHRLLRCR